VWDRFPVPVRKRTETDIELCVRLARVVHKLDGYPQFLPEDLHRFLNSPYALAAWVAEIQGEIVGHVALHTRSSSAVLQMAAEALKLAPDRLGVVARLLVAPEHRRKGIGRSLLEVASQDAHARGLWPVLDVVTHHQPAIALYDKCGWVRAGQVTSHYGDDITLDELVYLGPDRQRTEPDRPYPRRQRAHGYPRTARSYALAPVPMPLARESSEVSKLADPRTPGLATASPKEAEKALQNSCTRFLVANGIRSAAEMLGEIEAGTEKDYYGEGGVVAELESEVAGLLRKPSAVFLPTGTMAQQVTLRVHADRRGRSSFVGHPACHLDWREGRGYQTLHGLSFRQAGELRRPLTAADLEAVGEAPAALLVELPQRDLGGHLPAWDDLEAQVAWAHGRGAAAHLDGARLWEAAAGYERPPGDVAALFDTVYVSFYKGLGSIGGCCVAGASDVMAEVREWRTRHGGTVFGLWPYAASSLTSLRKRLSRMPDYRRHALAIAEVLQKVPGAEVVPCPPPTSHLHVLLSRDAEELHAAVVRLAEERQIWTFSRLSGTDVPGVQRVELPVGEATMTFTPEEIGELVSYLLTDGG